MKREDYMLVESRPDEGSSHFTERVMSSVQSKRDSIKNISLTQLSGWNRKLRFAILAIIIASCLTGSVYAAYKLWIEPRVTRVTEHINVTGRIEIGALIENCTRNNGYQSFEVTKSKTLPLDEAEKYIVGRCEDEAVQQWVGRQWPHSSTANVSTMASPATTIVAVTSSSITLQDRSVDVSPNTIVVSGGQENSIGVLASGDTVMLVESITYASSSGGAPTSRKLEAIVKLLLPPKYYNESGAVIKQRVPCQGNIEESCLDNYASIDILPTGEGDNSLRPRSENGTAHYSLQGRIENWSGGTSLKIVTNSGNVYSVTLPNDALTQYNQQRSQLYGLKIANGSTLALDYLQLDSEDHKTVKAQDIFRIVLLIESASKNDSVKPY